jgi:Xaa-Pro aminopeptidase
VNVLIYGDTTTSPAMRHELPLAIGDPFLYLESDGRRAVLTNALEEARITQAAPDVERLLEDALGRDELISAGYSRMEVQLELCVARDKTRASVTTRGRARSPWTRQS